MIYFLPVAIMVSMSFARYMWRLSHGPRPLLLNRPKSSPLTLEALACLRKKN